MGQLLALGGCAVLYLLYDIGKGAVRNGEDVKEVAMVTTLLAAVFAGPLFCLAASILYLEG